MSKIALSGNASGTGTFTFAAPNSNSDRTLTLPDAAGTLSLGITLGTAVASTSGTAIDFTGIPSWAKRVTVMFSGISTNGTSSLLVQVGSGSIATSGYASTSWSFGGANLASTAGFPQATALNASIVWCGHSTITLVSGNTYTSTGILTGTTTFNAFVSGGNVTLSGALDRLRITTVDGTDTFDAGTINVSWEG